MTDPDPTRTSQPSPPDQDEALSELEQSVAQFMNTQIEQHSAVGPAPPTMLYHYTGVGGLLSIIETKQLWATSAPFLNDQTEVLHTLLLLKRIISQRDETNETAGVAHDVADRFMLFVVDNFYTFLEVYLVCFCTSPDLLSQWRGYGQAGGYAIGFSTEDLSELSFLQKVNYDPVSQSAILQEIARGWRAIFHNATGSDVAAAVCHPRRVQLSFAMALSRAVTTFKNKAFNEEKEWRLVQFRAPMLTDVVSREFRHRNGMLLPYVPLSRPGEDGQTQLLPITEVWIGPRSYGDIAGYALQQLLADVGYEKGNVRVRPSEVPLRT